MVLEAFRWQNKKNWNKKANQKEFKNNCPTLPSLIMGHKNITDNLLYLQSQTLARAAIGQISIWQLWLGEIYETRIWHEIERLGKMRQKRIVIIVSLR